MISRLFLPIFVAILIMVGATTPAWAAQMEVRINPDAESSPFYIRYQKTVFIEYPEDGLIHDQLNGQDWHVTGSADSSNPGVQDLMGQLNQKILDSKSQASISDLNVSYDVHLRPFGGHTSVDYNVALSGDISNYFITRDSQRALIDLGWRGLSAYDDVVIDGVEINTPISILESHSPETYELLAGTAADDVLLQQIINADFILEQSMTKWQFLFDPTGINVEAGTFGLSDEIAGFVVSQWTIEPSNIITGIQSAIEIEATVVLDREYTVKSKQSADGAFIQMVGYGTLGVLDGIEIAGVTPESPPVVQEFPVFIIYGMAGIAAVAGIGFFFVSNRSLKNQSVGQQGIDPSRLVGYQTSSSSGGYRTNRGEAQLRDNSDYQQTRNVYDNASRNVPPPAAFDAACGCSTAAETGSECDCKMQDSCLCDASCQCSASICRENSDMMG